MRRLRPPIDLPMYVCRVATLDELEALAPLWNELAGPIPFRRHEWLASWWRHYSAGKDLYTLLVEEDGEPIGLAPLYLQRSVAHGRCLRLLGDGDVCTDYLGLLCKPLHSSRVATALADWLRAAASDRTDGWDCIRLEGVDAQDAGITELVAELAARGCLVEQKPGPNCWRLEFPGDWATYESMLSKTHRKRVRRLIQRSLDSGRATVFEANNPTELQRGREVLIDLHQRRRHTLGELGCFSSLQFSGFHNDAMPRLLQSGMLQLTWLELDGEPAAAEYNLTSGGVIYSYQSGVAPELIDEEPGRLLAVATLRRGIEQGCKAFDFLRGDEPYKASFRAQPRPLVEYRIAARRTTARIRHHAWSVRERMKDWWRATRAERNGCIAHY